MEGVKLDELSTSDNQRLHSEYDSSHELSSLSDDALQQLIEDLSCDVRFILISFYSMLW